MKSFTKLSNSSDAFKLMRNINTAGNLSSDLVRRLSEELKRIGVLK
jgi:hypothetical protein